MQPPLSVAGCPNVASPEHPSPAPAGPALDAAAVASAAAGAAVALRDAAVAVELVAPLPLRGQGRAGEGDAWSRHCRGRARWCSRPPLETAAAGGKAPREAARLRHQTRPVAGGGSRAERAVRGMGRAGRQRQGSRPTLA